MFLGPRLNLDRAEAWTKKKKEKTKTNKSSGAWRVEGRCLALPGRRGGIRALAGRGLGAGLQTPREGERERGRTSSVLILPFVEQHVENDLRCELFAELDSVLFHSRAET